MTEGDAMISMVGDVLPEIAMIAGGVLVLLYANSEGEIFKTVSNCFNCSSVTSGSSMTFSNGV